MLHFLNEGGNAELKHRFFPLGINIRKHLQRTLNNYNGDKDVDGYKRLVNILSMENGIAYNEMKRIKNFFDNFQGSQDSIEFILNGGQPMMLWVNATLNRATQTVKDFKAAKKAAGIKNAYIRPHEKDRQNKTKEPTTAKFQTRNAAKDIDSNNAIKYESKNHKQQLTESQESKSISKAKKLVMNKKGWNEQRADQFIRVELRGQIPVLRTDNGGKFILGVARMFCDNQLTDGGTIMSLNRTLELVASDAHINEYDRNLNGMSAEELIERFAGARQEMGNKDREEVAALDLQENNDYTIVQIDNLEQASKYAQYTDWCVTRNQDMIDSYTSGGIGQFYFCLKNGFENVPAKRGEGCPLDEYGLSMVSVVVDGDGNLAYCTCRWNHDNGGNDNIMDTKQISQLIGRNFYNVFKPNNTWKTLVDNAMSELESGAGAEVDVFDNVSEHDGFYIVSLKNRWNILRDKKLVLPNKWYEKIKYLGNDLFFVRTETGGNVINGNGNGEFLIPNRWFNWIQPFSCGYACLSEKASFHNYIDINCNFLFPGYSHLYWATSFENGVAVVCHMNKGYSIIDTNGNFIKSFDENYHIGAFNEGFAIICDYKEGRKNFIDRKGELLSPNEWFLEARPFYDGLGLVQNSDGKWNLLKNDGSTVFSKWRGTHEMPIRMTDGHWYIRVGSEFKRVNYDGEMAESVKHKRTITITEEQYRQLLSESQESKSISAAKKLVMQKFGWDEQRADKFVREELRGDIPALRTRNGGKFILGVTRMFLDRQITDGGTIQQLNRTIELVASDAHINEYDRDLNGMSAQELIDRFASVRQELGDKDREEVAALDLQANNDYTIVKIDNFKQASQYGQYTSWCVTHGENMLNHYTSDGIGQFYFCLKNGFESIPEKPGKGCPLDEYGLSMVAVNVDQNGNLAYCTCRWNHDNGGDDHIMDTKQISQLIGRNFYDVFKPNGKIKDMNEEVKQRLANGDDLEEIFDEVHFGDCLIVKLNRMFNFIRTNGDKRELGSEKWFKIVKVLCKGFLVVSNDGSSANIVKYENGELVSPNQWFSFIGTLRGTNKNLFRVRDFNGYCNIMDENGRMILPEEFCTNIEIAFHCGYVVIYDGDNGYNYVNENGQVLSKNTWFSDADAMSDNVGLIFNAETNKHGYIDTNGNFLGEGFDYACSFQNGFALVGKRYTPSSPVIKFNYINTNGDLLSPNQWFDEAENFNKNGIATVRKNDGKTDVITTDGKFVLSDIPNELIGWIEQLYDVDLILIKVKGKWNFIGYKGKFLSDEWFIDFDRCWTLNLCAIRTDKGWNYIDTEGNILFPNQWFYFAGRFRSDGTAHIQLNDNPNSSGFINTKGEISLPNEQRESKQRKNIIITEAQAFDLLLEAASLGDVYQKYYSEIPENDFREIVASDPTSGYPFGEFGSNGTAYVEKINGQRGYIDRNNNFSPLDF